MNKKIISLLALFGFNQTDYANHMSMSKSSLSNKMKRGSYTAKDLIIAHVPARVKCAVLAWHTLEEALDCEGKLK